jgi:hypothetical protein
MKSPGNGLTQATCLEGEEIKEIGYEPYERAGREDLGT